MNRLLLLLSALIVLFGCNQAESDNSLNGLAPQTGLTYSYVEVNERTPSKISPMGFWETRLQYPSIDPDSTVDTDPINKIIIDFVGSFECDDGGDQTFTGKITRLDTNMLVMSYESMWMCESMPSPDYEVGTATIDLHDLSLKVEKD